MLSKNFPGKAEINLGEMLMTTLSNRYLGPTTLYAPPGEYLYYITNKYTSFVWSFMWPEM